MKTPQQSFVRFLCEHLGAVEKKTVRELGLKRGNFFATLYSDCLEIFSAVAEAYAPSGRVNLVFHALAGTLKELHWYQFLFVSGNYPLLNSRLRFVWELMFRCYYSQTYAGRDAPGPSADEKMQWLVTQCRTLNWNTIAEVLKKLFPLEKTEQAALIAKYKTLWEALNLYVHPSGDLLLRMIDTSALHLNDGFDRQWALDTIDNAGQVFELVWFAVIHYHLDSMPALAKRKLHGKYLLLPRILKAYSGAL
jgi:hypothetical protein